MQGHEPDAANVAAHRPPDRDVATASHSVASPRTPGLEINDDEHVSTGGDDHTYDNGAEGSIDIDIDIDEFELLDHGDHSEEDLPSSPAYTPSFRGNEDAQEVDSVPNGSDHVVSSPPHEIEHQSEGEGAKKRKVLASEGEADAAAPSASASRCSVPEVPVPRLRMYTSPEQLLRPISPPGCTILLNHNDHRWVAAFKKGLKSEFWIDELAYQSHSQSFSQENWLAKLQVIHQYAWDKWGLGLPSLPQLKLAEGESPQTPGVIPPEIVTGLQEVINNLPAKKAYSR